MEQMGNDCESPLGADTLKIQRESVSHMEPARISSAGVIPLIGGIHESVANVV
jgi:hypothetical protein